MTRRGAWVGVVCSLVVGSVVSAQQSDPSQALAGPRVEDEHAPGVAGEFSTMTGKGGGKRDERRVPPEAFSRAVWSLRSVEVGEDLRLTKAQVEAMEMADREFRDEMRAYWREHREEFRALRRALGEVERAEEGKGPVDRRLGPGGGGRSMMMEEEEEAEVFDTSDDPALDRQRERMRELAALRPTGEGQRVRVWATLSDAQRERVQGEVDRMMEERRAKFMAAAKDLPPGFAERESVGREEFKRRFEERIKSLPPEEQGRARKRMERTLRGGEPGGGKREMKPAPGMDGVDVPGSKQKKSDDGR